MHAMERERRRVAFLNQQLETQRQLGKNEAEIEALQRQIKEQNDKLAAMQSSLDGKKAEADVKAIAPASVPVDKEKDLVGAQGRPWWKPW